MNLEEELGKLKETDITLVVADADDYVSTNKQLMNYLVNDQGLGGIYVTVNKPYVTIKETLEDGGVATDNIFFIDAISEDAGIEAIEGDNVVSLDGPENLTDISIAISEAVDGLPDGRKFLFLDSLSTLTVYNEMGQVSQFAHFLIGKMRKWKVAGVIVSLEAEVDEELISQVGQFCDVVLRDDQD